MPTTHVASLNEISPKYAFLCNFFFYCLFTEFSVYVLWRPYCFNSRKVGKCAEMTMSGGQMGHRGILFVAEEDWRL
jgi:hypothetical protein